MSNQISPKYQMNIIQNINDKLYELFKSYDDVEAYVCKWQVFYDDFGNANFYIQYKDNEHKKIDLKKTLHQIDGETLLKIAIDLGLDTPDFIPSIPMFKNELKSSFETAAQTFEKAYCNVEKDPSLAIGLANSALESIIKVLIYISTLENHRKGWSREIPEPVFSIYLTILFPLLSKQKPKTYLYRLLLLPCC